MRTTLDIDGPILHELKKLQKRERKSLGQLASELLAVALKQREAPERAGEPALQWISKPMGPWKVDLLDKEAVAAVLDAEKGWPHR